MEKDFLPKVGVFILIGLNVGGFYVFWPRDDGHAKAESKVAKEEKGETHLRATKPKELSPKSVADAAPLPRPEPQKKPATVAFPDDFPAPITPTPTIPDKPSAPDDPVSKLLDQIKKDSGSPMPKDLGLPALPMSPGDEKPKSLPPLDAAPIGGNVGVTSLLTPKAPISPWTFKTEVVGKQTLLIAQLQTAREPIELRIQCDRFDTKAGGNEVVIAGNVAIESRGARIDCGKVTLVLDKMRVAFEDNVISHLPTGVYRSDRIEWDLAPMAGGNAAAGVLGSPK